MYPLSLHDDTIRTGIVTTGSARITLGIVHNRDLLMHGLERIRSITMITLAGGSEKYSYRGVSPYMCAWVCRGINF
jgi:hypothetical protein